MAKRNVLRKIGLGIVFFLVLVLFSSNVFASDKKVNWSIALFSSSLSRYEDKEEVVRFRGERYRYHNGRFSKPGFLGFTFIVPQINTYVGQCAVNQPDVLFGESVIINIPNSNGSYTAIKLVKQRDGYIGPQGEYYPRHPTVEQLIALYGK